MDKLRIGCNTLYPDFEDRKKPGWIFTLEKIKQAIGGIAAAGYTDVEYSHIFQLNLKEAVEIGEYARKAGLNNWSCHAAGPDGHGTDSVEASVKATRHCVDVTSAIGAKVIVLHLWNFSHDNACRILEQICPYAASKNTEIALENFDTLEIMDFILAVVDTLKFPNLGINVDTGHANLGDLGAGRAIRMAGSRLLTTHLHDNFGINDDHMPPGTGKIDWKDVSAAIREIGYQRTLMAELTDSLTAPREYDQNREINTGFKNLNRIFKGI